MAKNRELWQHTDFPYFLSLIQKVTKKSRRFEAESLLLDVFLQRTAGGKYECVKALLQVFAACHGWLMQALAFSPGWFSHTFTSLGVEKEAHGNAVFWNCVRHYTSRYQRIESCIERILGAYFSTSIMLNLRVLLLRKN